MTRSEIERVNSELIARVEELERALAESRRKRRRRTRLMRFATRHLLRAFFEDGHIRERRVAEIANSAFRGLLFTEEEDGRKVREMIFGLEVVEPKHVKTISRRAKHGFEDGEGIGGDLG